MWVSVMFSCTAAAVNEIQIDSYEIQTSTKGELSM